MLSRVCLTARLLPSYFDPSTESSVDLDAVNHTKRKSQHEHHRHRVGLLPPAVTVM